MGRGPNNCLTDVRGLRVGGAVDETVRTGVTAVTADAPFVVAGDVRGGGPGTRETDLLRPSTLVDRADAIVLAGGSSYGLAAADGAAAVLGARGRGFQLMASPGVPPSPIVPAAILYDLANGGDKNWGAEPPYAALGRRAVRDALDGPGGACVLGRAGAGYGASAGDGAGGLGAASYVDGGATVGALVAVNSFGAVRTPDGASFWAAPFEIEGEFGGARAPASAKPAAGLPPNTKLGPAAVGANTTIAIVAVDVSLSQADAERIAIMAQDGLARAIRPVHGPTDGDVVFALSVPPAEARNAAPARQDPLTLTRLGAIAADCLARAVARGVYEAERSP
ncbi:MAG: P1 family peptidase [Parvularculaceae bacterium]